ncbi:MAG: nucleotidyltransferase family protein [Gaiellaceae bacterium]
MPEEPSLPAPSLGADALRAAGAALVADHVALDVVRSFTSAGIPSVLLRGPTISRHLYGPGEVRGYVDADVLVPVLAREKAEGLLVELGFRHHAVLGQSDDDRPRWSSTWIRDRDGGNVDLHWTLVGSRAAPEEVWNVFSAEIERVDVLEASLDGLSAAATAVVVALHAAHHGADVDHPLVDLARAVERLPVSTWVRAADLARRLDAPAFAIGLRILPGGAALADDLGLGDRANTEEILRASTAPPMALGFDWLAQTPGPVAKLRLISRKIVPDRAFMYGWSPLARSGGRRGLALAYLWRPVWLLWHAVPGLRAWLAARRRATR